jgi:hypothetical protein
MSGFSVTLIWQAAARFFTCAGHKQDDGSDPPERRGALRAFGAKAELNGENRIPTKLCFVGMRFSQRYMYTPSIGRVL